MGTEKARNLIILQTRQVLVFKRITNVINLKSSIINFQCSIINESNFADNN